MDGFSAAELGRLVEQRARSSEPLDRLQAAVATVDDLRGGGEEVLDRQHRSAGRTRIGMITSAGQRRTALASIAAAAVLVALKLGTG